MSTSSPGDNHPQAESASPRSGDQEARWMCDLTVPHTWSSEGSKKPPGTWLSPCGDRATGGRNGWSRCEKGLTFHGPACGPPHPFLWGGSSCRPDCMLFGTKSVEWKKESWNQVPSSWARQWAELCHTAWSPGPGDRGQPAWQRPGLGSHQRPLPPRPSLCCLLTTWGAHESVSPPLPFSGSQGWSNRPQRAVGKYTW